MGRPLFSALRTVSAALGCLMAATGAYAANAQKPANPFNLYVVEFSGPAANLTKDKAGRFDARSPEAQTAYAAIAAEQATFLASAKRQLKREVQPVFSYKTTLNGVALKLAPDELAAIDALGGFRAIYPAPNLPLTTDSGPRFIGAPAVWNAPAFDPTVWNTTNLDVILRSGFETTDAPPAPLVIDPIRLGSEAVIGVIDSGANLDSPAFADRTIFGYTYPASPKYGRCLQQFVPIGEPPERCNNKLIGAWDFIDQLVIGVPGVFELPGVEDENGHGSHTASTAGGNIWAAQIPGTGGSRVYTSGVAPLARLFIYDACFTDISVPAEPQGLCSTAALLAAIDTAGFEQVVDVINYSISGGDEPWNDAIARSMLSLENAGPLGRGVLLSASAGNSGPAPNTIDHQEPWVMTVGASTHDRAYFRSGRFSATGPSAPPPSTVNIDFVASSSPALTTNINAPLRAPSNLRACNSGGGVAAGSLANAIAVIERGDCTFAEKVTNATSAGARAVVVFNNAPTPPFSMGALEAATISAVMISQSAGQAIVNYVGSNPTATGLLERLPATPVIDSTIADRMAVFSSRGPSAFDVIKPDLTAPGVAILAASQGDAESTAFLQGTSMAAPHAAGAAALLRSINPSLRPQELRSALMLTATAALQQTDGVTATTPFDRGSGRIRVDQAARAGLVMDESISSFIGSNPANLGSTFVLNTASLGNDNCSNGCRFTRYLRSVATAPVTWTASVTGVGSLIFPGTFTINPGQVQTLQIDFRPIATHPQFNEVTLTPSDGSPVLRMPVALGARPPTAFVAPQVLTSVTNTVEEVSFAIRNLGGPTLTFSIDNSVACSGEVVPWLVANPTSATLGADEVAPIALRITANNLATGVYRGKVCVLTNDSNQPSIPVNITLTRP